MEIKKCFDGFIKITIPEIGVITWARDLEDAEVAIEEALEAHRLQLARLMSESE